MNAQVAPDRRLQVPAAKVTFLPEDRQWIAERIAEVLETGQLTLGVYTRMFEERFAERCGVAHAVAVNSGTSSLEIILRAIDVTDHDVLVPTNTFFATAAAVVHAGGRVVLTDADAGGLGPSVDEIERRLTPRTRAIVLVHIGGNVSPEVPAIRALAQARGVKLVEDAAHAHGSSLDGVPAGALADAASFSFYPTKVMTSAEGGMIVTDDEELAQVARIFRDQGKASFGQNTHVRMGYNWRLSEPHAIIGLRHLVRLDEMLERRRRVSAIYDEGLGSVGALARVAVASNATGNAYKHILRLRPELDREVLRAELAERFAVALSGEVYKSPLHHQPVFADLPADGLVHAEAFCRHHVCLPVSAEMTDEQAHHVVDAVRTLLDR